MVNRYFLTMVLLLLMITGCAGTSTSSSSKKEHPLVVDPVCAYFSDMGCINITVEENTPKSSYGGVTYYFCSTECKVDFDKNPSKYLKVVKPMKGAVDSVCHMKIEELEGFVTCEYQNKIYYFCSDHCKTKYMANPDYYRTKE